MDYQGGKKYGQVKAKQENNIDSINKEYLDDDSYKEVEDLQERLERYKKQFIEFDLDNSGDIDFNELKQMLEKIGQPKTHLECKKMIKEIDKTGSETINYREFLDMMLGSKNSVLRLILMFEEKAKQDSKDKAKGPPPKRTIDQLLQQTSGGAQ